MLPLKTFQTPSKTPKQYLSWFGFTEGFYRLQIGSGFLLDYSNEFVETFADQFPNVPNDCCKTFVDYYVVRIWEDLLDMLPNVLEPLLTEISSIFADSKTAWFEWESSASDWIDRQSNENEAIELFDLILSWQHQRRLDCAYLQNAPRIWIWSTEQSVVISWNNTDIALKGIPVWSAKQGHYSMQRIEFLNEVHAFHNQLIHQMSQRVETVSDRWQQSEVYVDLQHLRHEQQDRETWLEKALKKSTSTQWDQVIPAISLVCEN